MVFEPITLAKRDIMERIRLRSGKISSAVSFQSLYYWQDVQKLDVYITDDLYLVCCREKGERCFFMPVGSREKVLPLLTALSAEGQFTLYYSDRDDVRWLSQCFPEKITLRKDRDASEYIFDLNTLTALRGQRFAKIRKLLHRIERTHMVEIRQITPENRQEMQRVLSAWLKQKQDHDSADLAAAERMIRSVGSLPFTGILICLDGTVAAAAGGFPLSEEYFDMCFVKDTRSENGLGIYSRLLLARHLKDKYRYFNSEEDLGHPGLRALKESLHPVRMIDMWEVVFSGAPDN